jgi:diguanylate cyclase (GGDEF)-like protein
MYPEWLSITAVHAQARPAVTNYVATFSDITHQKQNEERIQLLAFSDPLTGPAQPAAAARPPAACPGIASARNKRHGALFFIDLDDFKDLNDTLRPRHGRPAAATGRPAPRRPASAKSDTVARLGGDEFVVMLEDLSRDTLEAVQQAETMVTPSCRP